MNIKLRNIDYSKDLMLLYNFMMDDDNQMLFLHSFQIQTIQMFEHWLSDKLISNEYHDFFMIDNSKGETVGFTYSYDFHVYDEHCKYTLCLFEKYQNKGFGIIAGVKMMDYLFSKYPLNQIFISVFDYNVHSLNVNRKGGFNEVGLLPDYRYYGGKRYSMHILMMSRETFYLSNQKMINKVNKEKCKEESL